MTTKKLLLLATMLALPFGARGDWTYNGRTYHLVDTPAEVGSNGTVTIANNGPYQIATIQDDDDEHIASTAYVKGAYNDTIAAINAKQQILDYDDEDDGVGDINKVVVGSREFLYILSDEDVNYDAYVNELVTAKAVLRGIHSQHVTIYTTWEDDTANGTTVVPLTTVVPED